jgi:hypothetical protein
MDRMRANARLRHASKHAARTHCRSSVDHSEAHLRCAPRLANNAEVGLDGGQVLLAGLQEVDWRFSVYAVAHQSAGSEEVV